MSSIWQTFFRRYYEWSLSDWKREVDEDFRLLKLVNSGDSRYVIRLMETYSREQRLKAASHLVRHINQHALPSIQESINEADRRFNDYYLEMLHRYDEEESRNIDSVMLRDRLTKPFNRRRFRSCIAEKFNVIMGDSADPSRGGEFSYKTSVGPWTVWTSIDTGGRYHQLTYEHDITDPDGKLLFGGISLLRWLGISGQTMWQGLENSDIESAAEGFAIIVRHFLGAVPKLLEGLEPDDFLDYRILQRKFYEQGLQQ